MCAPSPDSLLDTALWAVFTSLPQPVASVPAFLFVSLFESLVPVGLGLAGGAMLNVSCSELFPDACKDLGKDTAWATALSAFGVMTLMQRAIHDSTNHHHR